MTPHHSPLELSFRVDAPRERVWEAWTTADGLSAWWWSHWDQVEIAVDARVGGSYRLAAPAHGMSVAGEYLQVDPGRRLGFTWVWSDDDGDSVGEAVDVSFADDGDGTRIGIRHTGPWTSAEPGDAYREGWRFVLRALAEATASSGAAQPPN